MRLNTAKNRCKELTGCLNPTKIKLAGKKYWAPCGKCIQCKKNIIEHYAKKEVE